MLYYQERGNIISQGASYTNDYLPIGLIYPSDYIFTFAYNVSMISDKGGDYQSAYSWLTNLNVDFTISRNVDSLLIYGIFNPYVDPALDIISVFSYGDIHPVVYLNANVILNPDIETQDGSISHPYVFLSTD